MRDKAYRFEIGSGSAFVFADDEPQIGDERKTRLGNAGGLWVDGSRRLSQPASVFNDLPHKHVVAVCGQLE